ncbi:transposase IS4 family domain protein [Acinetobacter baumannii 655555]|nr:transposase IS4 family domain protein [Acinetobacter baumannii 655555]
MGTKLRLIGPLGKAVLAGCLRTIWKKWSGYHRRSLVETKMHCIKLLGDKLSARNFQSQVNEIHARMAVLNKFTDLGRPHTRVVT